MPARTNHLKSALGGATYVYASWIRCPLVLAVPNQNHRRTDAQNQLIHCSLVGYHKFKPKSQYKGSVCELNLLLVMILNAFYCNVNIRLHLKPQAVMQKYMRLRICCGSDFFIMFMMPIVNAVLFDIVVMCEFQSI